MKGSAPSYTGDKWQSWTLNPGPADAQLKMTFEPILNQKLGFTSDRNNAPRAFLIAQRHKTTPGV